MILKITENGDITFDNQTREYTVWNETYVEEVCKTHYLQVAHAALEAYTKHYVKGDISGSL